ncbi:sialate O-acetylesterase [Mariniflexile sp. HMF6888]|uniref:sialate O-acetylesterase n=1 Tax=Mariniflexile sp. HMF6888 TaxID=3373086 RepID=UPI0037A16CE4
MKSIIISFCVFLLSFVGFAQVQLPAIFGDGMVLQQQSNVKIWGKSNSKKIIEVITSWNNNQYTANSDKNGNWSLKVSTPKAGGPYEIIINDGQELILQDVLIGEVWVCSGQSNMYMPMSGYTNQPVLGALNDIVMSSNNSIRLFTVDKVTSETPQGDFKGEWQESIPKNVANFSAAAYYFGRMINKVLNVPVGLISSSWGGTRIEPWISANTISEFKFIEQKDMEKEGKHRRPTYLFNGMINPMAGYGIKGFLWYQGEANRKEPDNYKKLLSGLIKDWRNQWDNQDLNFYYAQIAPFDYMDTINSAEIRQSMLDVSLSNIEGIGMACLMDVGEKDNIHPANKKVVGERLAYIALNKTYGIEGIEYSGPVLKEMKTEGKFLKLTFDHAQNGLTTYGKPLENFEIAGENKKFFRAKGFLTKEGIVLFADRVDHPVAVRYAYQDWVVGELFNTEGLPASSFQVDNWKN